jgi:hypothetical protein
LNQADSSSSIIKEKGKAPGKVKKVPTSGTHQSPTTRVNLPLLLGPQQKKQNKLLIHSEPEMLDFGVDGASRK